MALNDVVFIKGQGGLGRPLPGQDYISALLFYTANANLPSGYSTSNRILQFFSVQDAENAGIGANYSDETQAIGVYTISAIGANGDKITLNFTEPEGVVVFLGSFVKTAAESTVTLLATALVAAINARTYITGYSATNIAGAISVKVRKGLGVWPNTATTPLSATIVGTIVGSITTAPAGGVASKQAVWHYHIAEFFRMQPKGYLYVGFYAVPATYDYVEIQTMQEFSAGKIRQIGIYKDATAYTPNDTTAIQTIANALDALKMPLSAILGADISATADISTLADLSAYTNNKVSVVIGQDAGGLGLQLWYAYGKSIGILGATLGTVALAKVSEDIAWVGKFNVTDGIENDSVAFANGVKFSSGNVPLSLQDAMDNKRYIFLRKYPNQPGTYFNESHTAITLSSDYAYIENNRVIDKAIRGIYATMLPLLASPLVLNADGTLQDTTVAFFESQASINVAQMERDQDLSAFSVVVDPNQNVATTSTIIVTVKLLPVGVARQIIVNIGFTTSI